MNIIEAKRVTKTYPLDDRHIRVLEDISLAVAPGEFLVVQGSSGSGKTTLLSLLSGLDRPTSGKVFIDGKDITDASEDNLARLRNTIFGFVFQSFHLVPSLTAIENVMFPAELRKDAEALSRADELMERVGMGHRKNNYPHQLSGGEKQRTAMCRALINQPKIIFADEPTGNLDSENGRTILELLREFHEEQRTTLVLVTHSEAIAGTAGRIVVLSDGRIRSEGTHAP